VINNTVPFQWQEHDYSTSHGEGISRPVRGNRTKQYCVMVFPQGAPPFKWYTKAESKKHAVQYAQARWPGANAEVA